jgi:hypothetical protein
MLQYTASAMQYCNGSAWSSLVGSTGTGSQSMFSGWPDAIVCNITNPSVGPVVFIAGTMPYTVGSQYIYFAMINTWGGSFISWGVVFNTDGTFKSYSTAGSTGLTTTDCNTSISSLVASGKAFNFAKGNGGSGYLGATATATSPSRSGDLGTGLFSATSSTVSIATAGTEALRVTATQSVGIGTTTPQVSLDLGLKTDGLLLPTGTTGQRPSSAVVGTIRYNSTISGAEVYNGIGWVTMSSPCSSLISVAGASWCLIPASGLVGTHTYLYYQPSTGYWYKSPTTSTAWSWFSYSAVTGTYSYGQNATNLGSFNCPSSLESGTFGIGCSNGGGTSYKLNGYSPVWVPSLNSYTGAVCQDEPGIFAGSPCGSAYFYYMFPSG